MQPHMLGQHAVGWVRDQQVGFHGRADASRDTSRSWVQLATAIVGDSKPAGDRVLCTGDVAGMRKA